MPTPGGLLKAGDYIVDKFGIVYKVIARTSSTAPYSVRIVRVDGQRITGFRSEMIRERGMEALLTLETGQLPGDWHIYIAGKDAIQLEPPREAQPRPRYNPRREFRVRDAHRFKDPKDAYYYGEEVEISMRIPGSAGSHSQSLVMSDEDLLELTIKALTYLRDKAEGLAGPP